MPIITIRKSGTAKSIRGKIENSSGSIDKKLQFDQNGQVRVDVPTGKYFLGVVVTGKSGSTYKLEVTDPPASRCDVEGVVPASGFDFGAVKFQVF